MSPTRIRSSGIRFSGVATLGCLMGGALGAPVPVAAQGQGDEVVGYLREVEEVVGTMACQQHRRVGQQPWRPQTQPHGTGRGEQ